MDAVKVIKKSGAPGAVPAVTAYVDEPLLPKVSAEDAGKVIGVDENGELKAVNAGGGGGVLIIGFNEFDTLNKSYNEILEAYQNNIPIILSTNNQNLLMYIPFVIIPEENKIHMEFATFGYNSTSNFAELQVLKFDYNQDNTMTADSFDSYSIQATPLN